MCGRVWAAASTHRGSLLQRVSANKSQLVHPTWLDGTPARRGERIHGPECRESRCPQGLSGKRLRNPRQLYERYSAPRPYRRDTHTGTKYSPETTRCRRSQVYRVEHSAPRDRRCFRNAPIREVAFARLPFLSPFIVLRLGALYLLLGILQAAYAVSFTGFTASCLQRRANSLT